MTPLTSGVTTGSPDEPRPDGPASDAERRLVSVVFIDLVGFTTFAESRDPEGVREFQTAYFDRARIIVDRYGGLTEKFIGDAVMAVWGTPVAREDDAERAVRAALDLIDAVGSLVESPEGAPPLEARVGIVTGEAAVRLSAVGQGMVAGDVVNTAARVQSVAAPGTVVVDEATRAASSRAIAYRAAGEHQLKGRIEPARLFTALQVVAGSGGAQRFDGLEAPFLGRDRELRTLKDLFHETVDRSRARLAVVSGEPGVGKSRLGWELFKYLDGIVLTALWHVGRCRAYGEAVAYHALADMVRMRLRVDDDDRADVVLARLDDALLEYVEDAEERDWLRDRLAVLLGVGAMVSHEAIELERETLFAGWRRFLERLSEHAPVVLLFEDTQAADPGLLDFIEHLLEWSAERPIFLLALTRPELHEARPTWTGHQRSVSVVHLDPMGEDTIARMLDGLVTGLAAAARASLAARAEGNPLFAVETVRMLIDRDLVVPSDAGYVPADAFESVDDLGVPPTLHALVAARLDNLAETERRLVMDASVLGMSFTPAGLVALVRDVGSIDPESVEGLLASLAWREVFTIRADARSPEAGQYRFGQQVMRTVAYNILSRRDRKQRHLAAAAHLESTGDADDLAGVVANHYLDAAAAVPDDPDVDALRATAVVHLERAGDRARSLAAVDEARRLFERALKLAVGDEDRARLAELAGLMAYRTGDPLAALERYDLAHELRMTRGASLELAVLTSRRAEALLEVGRVTDALGALQAVRALWDEQRPQEGAAQLAIELGRAHLSLGDLHAATTWLERGSAEAEAAGAWETLARAFNIRAVEFSLRGRPIEGIALMKAALDLAITHDMPYRATIQLSNLAGDATGRDLGVAAGYALEAASYATRVGDHVLVSLTAAALAEVQLVRGDWDQIDEATLRAQLGSLHGQALHVHLTLLAALAVWRGQDPGFDAWLGDDLSAEDAFLREGQISLRSLVALAREDRQAIRELSRQYADILRTNGIEANNQVWPCLVADALDVGDLGSARHLLQVLWDRPPGLVPPLAVGQMRWLEARLAALEGDDERASRLFEESRHVLDELGAGWWLARVELDDAVWAQQRGRHRRAQQLASQARDRFAGLRATPFLTRADRLLGELGVTTAPDTATEAVGDDPSASPGSEGP